LLNSLSSPQWCYSLFWLKLTSPTIFLYFNVFCIVG
jgi:hypothetical protein